MDKLIIENFKENKIFDEMMNIGKMLESELSK